jgi:hypothetical protein
MIQEDRRKHPRFPVLIRCTLVTARDRRDAVCTQIGPAAAFLTGRLEQLQPGEIVHVEMRSGGLGTPIISLLALIVRMANAGNGNPPGLAVRWRAAACDLGPEPLLQFLAHVLRLPRVPQVDLTLDRHAEFDIEASLAGQDVRVLSTHRGASPRSAADTARLNALRHTGQSPRMAAPEPPGARPASARTEYGLLDDPMLRPNASAVGNSSLPAAADAGARPEPRRSDHFVAVPQRPPSGAHAPVAAAPLAPMAQPALVPPPLSYAQLGLSEGPITQSGQPVSTALRPSRTAIPAASVEAPKGQVLSAGSRSSSAIAVVLPPVDRSRMPRSERTPALGWKPPAFAARGETTNPGERSAMPLALGVGERSATFDVAEGSSPAAGPATVSFPVYALAPAERRQETEPNRDPAGAEQGGFEGSGEPTVESHAANVPVGSQPQAASSPSSGQHRRNSSGHFNPTVMLRANHAVRYSVGAQLRSGRAVAIGGQAVAVVTHEGAPELDQPVIVFLPIELPEGPMVIDLRGKLLQLITDTEAGPRFVLHIERVEEGHHKGAFHRFLRSLAG